MLSPAHGRIARPTRHQARVGRVVEEHIDLVGAEHFAHHLGRLLQSGVQRGVANGEQLLECVE